MIGITIEKCSFTVYFSCRQPIQDLTRYTKWDHTEAQQIGLLMYASDMYKPYCQLVIFEEVDFSPGYLNGSWI